MKCKDCLHHEVCSYVNELAVANVVNAENCRMFKDTDGYRAAEIFENCYVIDLTRDLKPVDDRQRETLWLNGGHMNPCGYLYYSKVIMSYMDYIIRHNIKEFDYVGFIGKEELLED